MPNPLLLALADTLRAAGFARKRPSSWFRSTPDVVQVVNLQKSQWGDQYYVNFAVWLLALGHAELPPQAQCHVRLRADDIVSSKVELRRLLDLDVQVADRRAAFARVLADELLPFADEARTLAGLRRLARVKRLKNALVLARARALLSAGARPRAARGGPRAARGDLPRPRGRPGAAPGARAR